jgi:putative CRISPR-associated protein (TIGR02620 family)
MNNKLIVTRHAALVKYLLTEGIVSKDTPIVSHATEEMVKGKHVIGVLPLRLAFLAERVTEVPLDIPAEKRGKELNLEEVQKYAGKPTTYAVANVGFEGPIKGMVWF